jgi:hypothetical protein
MDGKEFSEVDLKRLSFNPNQIMKRIFGCVFYLSQTKNWQIAPEGLTKV